MPASQSNLHPITNPLRTDKRPRRICSRSVSPPVTLKPDTAHPHACPSETPPGYSLLSSVVGGGKPECPVHPSSTRNKLNPVTPNEPIRTPSLQIRSDIQIVSRRSRFPFPNVNTPHEQRAVTARRANINRSRLPGAYAGARASRKFLAINARPPSVMRTPRASEGTLIERLSTARATVGETRAALALVGTFLQLATYPS